MPDISLLYRKKFLANQAEFQAKYRKLFAKVANDVAKLVNDPTAKFSKSFNFSRSIDQKITAIITDFNDRAKALTENAIRASWGISNDKNDAITRDYLKTLSGVTAASQSAFFMPNVAALEAFITRDHGSGKLSDAVWNVSKQLRAEMEIHLGLGISNGDSADVISRRIRQYLDKPDALFRRVRNEKRELVPSKAMMDYSPGKGVYKSSYKNALRVTRTETNMAYLLADHIRWQQLEMVIGVQVSLSAQHPDYKFPEICEVCEGEYPKEFLFVGWHPQCLCHATPILMPQNDFLAYLRGDTATMQATPITDYPEGFQNFMKGNFERLSKYKSVPYFMQDNAKVIAGIMERKVSVAPAVGSPIAKIVRQAVKVPPVSVNMPEQLKIGSNFLNGREINFDKKFFDLLDPDVRLSLNTAPSKEGAYYADRLKLVNIPNGSRLKASPWNNESIVYHEYGHAIDAQRKLKISPELRQLMSTWKTNLAKRESVKVWIREYDYTAGLYISIKRDAFIPKIEAVDYKLRQLSQRISRMGDKVFEKIGITKSDVTEQILAVSDTIMSINPKFGFGHSKAYFNKPGMREAEFIAHAFENRFAGNMVFKKYLPELYDEMIAFIDTLK